MRGQNGGSRKSRRPMLPGLPGGPEYVPEPGPQFIGYGPWLLTSISMEGRRALEKGEKGIILAPGLQPTPRGMISLAAWIDPQELRSSLLLWDRLDWPVNNLLNVPPDPDAQFLIDEGVMHRTQIDFSDSFRAFDFTAETNIRALEFAEQKEPGQWSLGRREDSASALSARLEDQRALIVRLYEAVPVPAAQVPLDDILRFKARRQSELRALQYHLDSIYQDILQAPDRARAADTKLAALDAALADHLKAIREAPFRKIMGSISASLDLMKVGGGLVAGAVAFAQGLPLTASLATGASALSVSLGIGRKGEKAGRGPFEYVSRYHKELF